MINDYTILYNFPTRLRPGRFIRAIENIAKLSDSKNYHILVKCDEDDMSMQTREVLERVQNLYPYHEGYVHKPYILTVWGVSNSKIHAVNRDIDEWAMPWDIMVTMSDDMEFKVQGYDNIIRSYMPADLDWLLHFPDTYALDRVCTMSIIGRNYYKRDGYVYNPEYYSLFCDEEQTEVAKLRERYKYINLPILDHNHYSNGRVKKDGLYRRNDTYRADQKIFNQRKANNFTV